MPKNEGVGDVFITGKYHVKQVILTLSPQAGNSALILAAWWGHRDTVMELVKAGAKLYLQNKVYKMNYYIGHNYPGISGTVTDLFAPSRIPDSFTIVPEVEERHTIRPLVAQVLASLAGIICLAACPAHLSQAFLWLAVYLALQPLVRNGNPQDTSDNVYVKWVWFMGVA